MGKRAGERVEASASGQSTAGAARPNAPAPLAPLGRRLSSLLYEGVLLFGLMLLPGALGALFVALGGKASPWQSDLALRVFATVLCAIYFTWFWSSRGQTLPMQTWHIRLVRADGGPVGQGLALLRFVAACVGYLGPAWVATRLLDVQRAPALGLYAAGVVCWALLARLDRERQFWHDRVCGTRLIDVRGEPRPGRAPR